MAATAVFALVLKGALAFFWATIWPVVTTFAGWIVAASAAVLAFLFSPKIRVYTIGLIFFAILLGTTFAWGYTSAGGAVKQPSLCDNPHFHQIVLPAGKYPKSVITAVAEHNLLGANLGCWASQ